MNILSRPSVNIDTNKEAQGYAHTLGLFFVRTKPVLFIIDNSWNMNEEDVAYDIYHQIVEYMSTGDLSKIDFNTILSDDYIDKVIKAPKLVIEQTMIAMAFLVFKLLREKNR